MSNLRRYYKEGQIYFITVVTQNRLPILIDNIDLLKDAFNTTYKNSTGEVWDLAVTVPKSVPIKLFGFTPAMLNSGSNFYRVGLTGIYLRE